ncbi:MAG: zinc-binding dehydrogenase [Candidatus Midichloriaceae bacterium]
MLIKIKIHAIGVNRADILQLEGKYPSPDGNKIPGLEVSGIRMDTGERVFALLTSGGYSNEVEVDEGLVCTIPGEIDYTHAAAIPEAIVTTWLNLYKLGNIHNSSNILIHGGASGICSMMIQFALNESKRVFTTSRNIKKLEYLKNFKNCERLTFEQFKYDIDTSGLKMDLIIDILGGKYLEQNLSILDKYGKLILFAIMDGKISEINIARILMKNLNIIGSTLRSKATEEKVSLFKEACENLLPSITEGIVKPIISKVYKFSEFEKAHQLLKSGNNIGKIILVMD